MAPYLVQKARWGARMGNVPMEDAMLRDGLTDTFSGLHMGITAETVAEQWGITREEMDDFSYNSQQKCEAAIKAGKFKDEIVPGGSSSVGWQQGSFRHGRTSDFRHRQRSV